MIQLQPAAGVLAMLALPALAHAGINETLARQIYVESGARQQLEDIGEQFPTDIRSSVEQGERTVPFNPDEMEEAARRAYSAAVTEKVVIEELQTRLQPADAEYVLQWLRGELGRRFTRLEIEASRAEAQPRLAGFAESLTKSPPPEDRMSLIQELQRSLRITEGATQLMMNMNIAIGIGMLDSAPQIDEQAVRRMRDSMEERRPQMMAEYDPVMFVMLLFSYRDVSNEDIQRYIAFASSPSGDVYHRAIIGGMDRALTAAGLQLGRELSKIEQSPNRETQS